MKRRTFLQAGAASLASLGIPKIENAHAQAAGDKPNIFFILIILYVST